MADSEELGVAWWQNALATRGALQNHWKYVLSVEAHLYVRPLEPYGSHTGLGVKGECQILVFSFSGAIF